MIHCSATFRDPLASDPWLDAAPTNRLVDEGDPRRSSRALFGIVATSA